MSELDKDIILKQVQGIYENIDLVNGSFDFIEILEIIISDGTVDTKLNQQTLQTLPVSNWNQMRSRLIDIYGVDVDRNWFSKLEVIEYEEKKEISVKAPSVFVKDWIIQNYWNLIEELANKGQQKISFC